MRTLKLFIVAVFAVMIFAGQNVYAVSAYPHPIQYVNPDGTELTIKLKGDEKLHWATTIDGYTLMRNSENYYEYAIKNADGHLDLSGIRANNVDERLPAEALFLAGLERDLRYSPEQIDVLLQLWRIGDEEREMRANSRDRDGPTRLVGSIRAPLVLVDFPGKTWNISVGLFEALMNTPNYTAGGVTGSVYDYFYANSYGQLQFQVDVFGPYRMANPISSYVIGADPGPGGMARAAAIAAAADGCNFALYDHDNDNDVDCFHVIFAGYGEEAGGAPGNSIWSHASVISPNLVLNGKRVYNYSCSPELRNNSGLNMTYMGVIAHELSHVFGLPDFYDTDAETGGEAVDLADWDIMASGSWNDDGRTPARHSAWSRQHLGWDTLVELTYPCDVTIPNPALEGIVYKVTTTTSGEYFLIENRQKIGWDTYIPASGMLVYHVNENNPGWGNNCINCNPANRGVYIKQAGGGATSTSDIRANDPYPYGTNNTFTDSSIPNSKSWAGTNTAKPITDITHNTTNRTIFFKFMGGFSEYTINVTANPVEGGTVTGGGVYQSGDFLTVTASPAEGYRFINWTESTAVVGTDTALSFQATANRNLVANFLNMDNSLSSLTISEGTLTPAFHPDTLIYSVTLPSDITMIDLTGVPNHPSATVGGNIVDYPIFSGTRDFIITVTAQDGSTRLYTVFVTRPISNDANLQIINISSGFLTPNFDSLTTSYTVNVDASVLEIDVVGIPKHAFAQVSGNSLNAPLAVGSNLFTMIVTAENGVTTKTYTVEVIRPISNDATLREINLSTGVLNPSFNPLVTSYTANVSSSDITIDVTGIPNHANATVTGNTTGTTLPVGTTPFNLNVTAEDGTTTKLYTVNVIRAASDDATLRSLSVNGGTLDPVFDPLHNEYIVYADFEMTTATITGVPNHPFATVVGNVAGVTLNLGANNFSIVVTAENGTTTRTYLVTIRRSLSNNALLESLSASSGTISPNFLPEISVYTVTVPEDVTIITLIGVPYEIEATVTNVINQPISLGPNFFTLTVTAPNLITTKDYNIIVNRSNEIFQITASIDESGLLGGVIDPPEGVTLISKGNSLTYTIEPNILHKVKSVVVDDVDLGPLTSYTFSNVTSNHTIVIKFVDITDGIENTEISQLSVYPNPTTGLVKIENYTLGVEPIQLYDISGKMVLETRDMSFNIAHLSAGVYVLKVDEYRIKIIKQ